MRKKCEPSKAGLGLAGVYDTGGKSVPCQATGEPMKVTKSPDETRAMLYKMALAVFKMGPCKEGTGMRRNVIPIIGKR